MSLLPQKLIKGFPYTLTVAQGEFKSTQGYALKVILRGPQNTEITATATDATYTAEVAAPEAGIYLYSIVAESLSDRRLLETGRVEFLPDPTTADGTDLNTHAERTLAAIEAVLEKRATSDQMSYSIAGRNLSRMPIADLLLFRDKYRAEVATQRGKQPRRFIARFA